MIYFARIPLCVIGATLAEALLSSQPLNGDYHAAREELAEVVALAQAVEEARRCGPLGREERERIAPVEAQIQAEMFQ